MKIDLEILKEVKNGFIAANVMLKDEWRYIAPVIIYMTLLEPKDEILTNFVPSMPLAIIVKKLTRKK